jgi:putative protease
MLDIIVTPYCIEDFPLLLKAQSYLVGNARFGVRLTKSFSIEEIMHARVLTKQLKKNLYINVNKIFLEDEVKKLKGFLIFLKEQDVDGIFFSDLGVYTLAKELDIVSKLVYYSETQSVNYRDVEFFTKLGIKAVIISKETTLENILLTGQKVKGVLGVNIYGHMHMYYSRRKLLKSYFRKYGVLPEPFHENMNVRIKERSRNEYLPIYQDDQGTQIFTGEILNGIDYARELAKNNISMFIIDGIFEKLDYLLKVLDYYDLAFNQPIPNLFDKMKQEYPNKQFGVGFYYKKIGVKA